MAPKEASKTTKGHDVESLVHRSDAAPLASQLKLREKLKLVSGRSLWQLAGVRRLGIPFLTVADGPHGVRKPIREFSLVDSHKATCFPTAAALACSWDVDLMQLVGAALRIECLHYNVSVLLGPGMNLKRHPAGGRNFEYFSEDPYLTGRLAASYIKGVQATGQVAACAKHFAVNNQEAHRFVVNAVVDERTARELYYRHFEHVVKESQPKTIMCAYNRLNDVYCSEHTQLNTKLLREEWGFEGMLMTDWGATNDRTAGIGSGMDLEMPGSSHAHDREIRRALDDGRLSETQHLDPCVQRMLNLIHGLRESQHSDVHVTWASHHELAKQVAMQCAVLLKNEDNLLPLQHNTSVAVIGDFAKDHPRYQGMGSSQVFSELVVSAYPEFMSYTNQLYFAPGYHADDVHTEDVDQELLQQAIKCAKKAQVAVLCVGLPAIMESEGFDRTHLGLPAQHNALVEEICKVHSNVVVVLSNGGAVEIPWADKPKAIFESYLLGETGGAAVVDLIFGLQSPCGKLAETMPLHQKDILADRYFPGTRHRVEHREGLDVGYRYFDSSIKHRDAVRFPFGHGLTYTTFEYSNLQVTIVEDEEKSKTVQVTFDVSNTGRMTAREVVQCYVHDVQASVYRPEQELKGFDKLLVRPDETRKVTLTLTTDAFSFYDIGLKDWAVEAGGFEIRIGSSSRDIRLRETITFETGILASPLARASYPPVKGGGTLEEVDNEVFRKRFGTQCDADLQVTDHEVPEEEEGNGTIHRNSLIKEISHSRLLGRVLAWAVYLGASASVEEGPLKKRQLVLMRETVENLPLRALVLFSKGGISFDLLDAMIASMNYSVWKALKYFFLAMIPFRRK